MRVLGHGDQMDVVGHEAITEDAHAGADGVVSQQVKIELAVVIGGEHGLPIVAALRDVVRHIRHHDSWTAGHMREVPDGQSVSQENASVTFSSRKMRPSPFPWWLCSMSPKCGNAPSTLERETARSALRPRGFLFLRQLGASPEHSQILGGGVRP